MPRLSKIGSAALAAFGWTTGAAAVSVDLTLLLLVQVVVAMVVAVAVVLVDTEQAQNFKFDPFIHNNRRSWCAC
jgi:hypothetical protein